MDSPFDGPNEISQNASQSNELIRYDLTELPTNVGDNVPEEL